MKGYVSVPSMVMGNNDNIDHGKPRDTVYGTHCQRSSVAIVYEDDKMTSNM